MRSGQDLQLVTCYYVLNRRGVYYLMAIANDRTSIISFQHFVILNDSIADVSLRLRLGICDDDGTRPPFLGFGWTGPGHCR